MLQQQMNSTHNQLTVANAVPVARSCIKNVERSVRNERELNVPMQCTV
jgi:hypothetical protein